MHLRNAFVAVLLGILTPSLASAQACLGTPVSEGGFAVGTRVSFTEGARGYGATGHANLVGPFAFLAGYTLVDFEDADPNGNSFGAQGAYELPVEGASVCPVIGVLHLRVSESEDGVTGTISQTTVPIGVGIGRTFNSATSGFGVTLSATPAFLYIRSTVSFTEGGASISASDSVNEFGANLSAVLNGSSVLVGAGVDFTTVEDSDPTFTVGIGFLVGG